MLILILIQYLQYVVFSFKKGSNGQNQPLTDSYHPMKKFAPIKISDSRLGGEISPYPFNAVWKTLACFTFPSWGVETTSTYFLVWLWTVTQFNSPKNEMSLKCRRERIWIWISKNESILRTTAWKGCWLLFYPKLCVGVLLCFR